MGRAWVLLVVTALLVTIGASPPHVEFNSSPDYMKVSTSVASLAASFVLIAFMALFPQKTGTAAHAEPVKIWERAIAFHIDYAVALLAVLPVVKVPMLLAEAVATGALQWSFERNFLRPIDYASILLEGLLGLAFVFGYFYVHSVAGRRSIGQYLLGFRVEGVPGADERPAFGLNVLLACIGLSAWPVSIYYAAKRRDKAFWWNLCTRTRLVRVI